MRFVIPLLLLALVFAGCATPRQPDLMPGAGATGERAQANAASGGISGESKPETGRDYGAPNPTSTYARGDADVKSEYSKEARQAGAIANPKSWTADTRLISSAPMSVKFAGMLLETYAVDLARTTDPCEREQIRYAMAALVDKAEQHQSEWVGAIAALAPSFDRCVLIQIDGSGSSTGEQDAVDPENTQEMAKGVGETLKGAEKILNGEFETSSDPSPDAPEAPDSPPEPPAGAVAETPTDAGGGA